MPLIKVLKVFPIGLYENFQKSVKTQEKVPRYTIKIVCFGVLRGGLDRHAFNAGKC